MTPDLVATVKRALNEKLRNNTPDAVPEVILATSGRRGISGIRLDITDDPDGKLRAAAYIIAFIVATGADEVSFTAAGWSAPPPTTVEMLDVDPSEHPERTEVLFISRTSREGSEIHTAPIIRRSGQPPVIGLWERKDCELGLFGFYGDHIEEGFVMARALEEEKPDAMEVRAHFDNLMATVGTKEAVYTIIQQMGLLEVSTPDGT